VENILDLSVLRDGVSLRVYPVKLQPIVEEIRRLSEVLSLTLFHTGSDLVLRTHAASASGEA
jgi:hypothetical protein